MMPLGTRVVPPEVDTLHRRIKVALNRALDQAVAADMYAGVDDDDRGLAARVPGRGGPDVRLSVDDVARIAAAEAYRWF